MKKSLLLVAAFAGVFVTGSAFAGHDAADVKAASGQSIHLTPAKVVSPTGLPSAYENATVKVEFSVDPEGQPQEIRLDSVDVRSPNERVLKRQLVEAFRQWRFDGDVNAASTTGQRFILPLKLRPEV